MERTGEDRSTRLNLSNERVELRIDTVDLRVIEENKT